MNEQQISEIAAGKGPGGREKVDALNTLAWELCSQNDLEQGQQLALQAYELASQIDNSGSRYEYGMAFSLINQAWVNTEIGQMQQALAQVNQALAMIDEQTHPELIAEAEHQLGWIYTNTGSHHIALNHLIRAYHRLESLGLPVQQAQVNNSLGAVYGELGETEKAIASLDAALDLLADQNNQKDLAIAHNNYAHILAQAGQYNEALPHAIFGLELTVELKLDGLELVIQDTLGLIYLGLQEYIQALSCFERAERRASAHGAVLIEIDARIHRCAVLLALAEFERAEICLLDSLAAVEAVGLDAYLVRIYELFSDLYEHQGRYLEALAYFRKFHDLQENIYREDSARNLENLQNAHLVESALKDAEIYRFKSMALQKEIDESNQIRAELEQMVRLDHLTGIFNRRYLFKIASDILEQARIVRVPVSVMMLDIDLFKSINDSCGHLAGDQVLMTVVHYIQQMLRLTDYFGRYGGDEFVVILPNTDLKRAKQAGERLREHIEKQRIKTDQGTVNVTISMGITGILAGQDISIDELLKQADVALYRAKQAGRNQMRVYQ